MHVFAADDSSSLLPIGELQELVFPGTHLLTTVDVDVVTVDDLLGDLAIPDRALLKLDVQGYELEVLKGVAHSLEKFMWVYSEVSFVRLYDGQALAADLIDHLHERRFRVVDVLSPSRFAGRSVQSDTLFERDVLEISQRATSTDRANGSP